MVSVAALAQVDRIDRERMHAMLRTAAHDVEKYYFDPDLGGLDWNKLTAEADRRIDQAKTPSEMISAIYLLIDKLHDSHTHFLPPPRVNRPLFGFEAKIFGNEVRIYEIKPGGAAEVAGLKTGDRILEINGYRPERKNFDQAMLYYRYLRPMPELKITYSRDSGPPQTLVLKAKVKHSTRVLDFTSLDNIYRYLVENFSDDEKYFYRMLDGDIGFLQIPSFMAEEVIVAHALEKPKAVVIDLRGNPGGRLDSLAELAGHFETESAVLANMVGRKKTEPVKIKPHGPNHAVPMFILVDSRTASAAEMFARYFQRRGRATVIGDLSSGRVNASQVYAEQVGSSSYVPFGMQISVARVAFSDGEELEKHGVRPDVPCLPSESDLREELDPCLKKAVALARKAVGRAEELPPKVNAETDALLADIKAYRDAELRRPD